MTTTYTGEEMQLAIVQDGLDRHVTSSADGQCVQCRVPGPCLRRVTATLVFLRFGRLPRRTPGITRPDLACAAPAGAIAWFGPDVGGVD